MKLAFLKLGRGKDTNVSLICLFPVNIKVRVEGQGEPPIEYREKPQEEECVYTGMGKSKIEDGKLINY